MHENKKEKIQRKKNCPKILKKLSSDAFPLMKNIKMDLISTLSFLKVKKNQVDRVDEVDHVAPS